MFNHAQEVYIRKMIEKLFDLENDDLPFLTNDCELKIGKTARWMFAGLIFAHLCDFDETYFIEYFEALLVVKCFEEGISFIK